MNGQQVKQGRGCFFYGCLVALALMVVVAVAAYFGVRYVVNTANALIEEYTEPSPMELPRVEISDADLQALNERTEAFGKALDEGTATEPLVLDTRDLNALIQNQGNMKDLADKIYLSLDGDEVRGQLSIPLDELPFEKAKGRYLNGEASLKVSLQNGVLVATLASLKAKGLEPPEQFLSQMRQRNLANDLYDKPEFAELMRKLESIEVSDGKVTVRARTPAAVEQ